MREGLANIIVIGLSVAFLLHFSLIAIHGTILIQEPCPYILIAEMVMMIGFIAFAIYNMTKIRRGK